MRLSALSGEIPEITERNFIRDSLYATIVERYDRPIPYSERYAVAYEVREQEVADLLAIQPFSPVLMITGVSFTRGQRPVDYRGTFSREGSVIKTTVRQRGGEGQGPREQPSYGAAKTTIG